MRKHCRFLGLALLAAAALVSCTREEILPVEPETPEEKPVEKPTTHTIMVTASNSEDTRTQIGADNMSSLWSAGDKLLVFQGCLRDYYGWYPTAVESGEGTIRDGGKKMVFPVDFDYEDPETLISGTNPAGEPFKFLYRAAYPAENALLDTDEGCYLVVNALSSQCPTETSFDPKADILTSQPVFLMEQPDNLNLAFKRQTALGQMTVKGLPEGATLYAVGFYPDTDVPSTFAINLMGDDEGAWYGTHYKGVFMKIPGWTVPAAGSDGATAVMTSFMVPPFELAQQDRFYLEVITREMVTDEDTGEVRGQLYDYWREVVLGENRDLVFTAGDLTRFSVNMTNAEREDVPGFEVTFSDLTLEKFPHLNDQGNRYLEIPFVVGGGGGGEGPIKKAKASPGDYISLDFYVSHPWTVSFSESWLSASMSGDDYGNNSITLYATQNDTGAPREATMTFTSEIYGEMNIRVVQESFSAPRSISLNAPQTVPAYTPFNPEVVLDTDDPDHYNFAHVDYEYDSNIKELDDGFFVLAPGTYSFYAYYYVSSIDYYMGSELVTVTVPEPDAPTDWYFLVKRNNTPYLIHRTGGSDTAIQLSHSELAEANDLRVSSDGKVYVAGAYPDTDHDNVMLPCLWTINGTSVIETNFDLSNGSAKKVVLEGEDIYVLANATVDYLPKHFVLKNNEILWTGPAYEEIFDIAVDNGHVYLCGASRFENWAVGNYAKLWTDGNSAPLAKYEDSDLYEQRYYPQRVAAKDGDVCVVGYVYARDRLSHNHGVAAVWEVDDYNFVYRSRSDWWWTCLYDMTFFGGNHRIYVGESYYNSSSNRQQKPVFYFDDIPLYLSGMNQLSLNYSGEAGLNQVQIYNGVPVLRGTVGGKPAFWEAPWKTPVVWNNDDDEMIGFAVK